MKINGSSDSSTIKNLLAEQASETQKRAKVSSQSGEEDKVTIGASKDLLSFLNVDSEKELRQAKIDKLKALIQSGEYKPDSRLIAAAIDSELNLEVLTSRVNWSDDE